MILGFDPGKDKCGVAVMKQSLSADDPPHIVYAEVVAAEDAIATVVALIEQYSIDLIVMGDQTLSKTWKRRIENHLFKQPVHPSLLTSFLEKPGSIPVVMIDERYSTLEARDRYWRLHPPKGLIQFVPQALRPISRPIDDVVAIILIERYWCTVEGGSKDLSVFSVP